jgi:hypothetical protein
VLRFCFQATDVRASSNLRHHPAYGVEQLLHESRVMTRQEMNKTLWDAAEYAHLPLVRHLILQYESSFPSDGQSGSDPKISNDILRRILRAP